MNKPLENEIRKVLKDCGKHCHFKKAFIKKFIPDGFTIVNIKNFPKELTKELEKLQ